MSRVDLYGICVYSGDMARIGRPPKASDEGGTTRIDLRVRPVDKKAMQEAADKAGLSLSSWIKTRLIPIARRELRR